jgi:CubicO group peptidase (beta-lactamase class C family)
MKKIALLLATLLTVDLCRSLAAQNSWSEIDALLKNAVDQKHVPMVVAMVADGKGVIYEHAVGASKDAIFAIASMTKPVTSVAVMQLVEAGRVKLDEPAATYLPELKDVRVFEAGTMRAPKTPPTVRQLLTHTSGFGYEFMNKDLAALVAKKDVPSIMAGGDAFLKAPIVFDPGTRWMYGISTDWLGRLVERVSGQTLEAYFKRHIFEPLDMTDTSFIVPAEKQPRIATLYLRTDAGLAAQPPPPASTEFFSGGGGLFSTAADYLKFVRALMAGGQLGGRRILSAGSVKAMGANHIGPNTIGGFTSLAPQFMTDGAILPGKLDKFGLGFALNAKAVPNSRGANTMSWAGIHNTFFWIDREKQVGAVLMSHMLPFLDPRAAKLLEDFDRAVYAMIVRRATSG